MLILLCILAVAAVHRIWHYEDIAAPARSIVVMDPAITPLLIAPVIVAGAVLLDDPWVLPALAVLACYPIVRGAVWVYEKYDPRTVCSPCKKNQERMTKLAGLLRTWDRRVILIGVPPDRLAKTHAKVLFIDTAANGRTGKNIHHYPVPVDPPRIMNLIMMCGSATVLTSGEGEDLRKVVATLGNMPAVSWVHLTGVRQAWMPPHHVAVATGGDLDTVLYTAMPPRPDALLR